MLVTRLLLSGGWLQQTSKNTTCKGGCRARKARKDSTENNFRDCYNHLWDSSRPNIVTMEREIRPKKSKVLIASDIEALVETQELFSQRRHCLSSITETQLQYSQSEKNVSLTTCEPHFFWFIFDLTVWGQERP